MILPLAKATTRTGTRITTATRNFVVSTTTTSKTCRSILYKNERVGRGGSGIFLSDLPASVVNGAYRQEEEEVEGYSCLLPRRISCNDDHDGASETKHEDDGSLVNIDAAVADSKFMQQQQRQYHQYQILLKTLSSHQQLYHPFHYSHSHSHSHSHSGCHHAKNTSQTQKKMLFHSTRRTEIAPFLPELVIAFGMAGGWIAYRKSQGKPIAPDSAMEARQDYQKMQQDLQERNEQWRRKNHRNNNYTNNGQYYFQQQQRKEQTQQQQQQQQQHE